MNDKIIRVKGVHNNGKSQSWKAQKVQSYIL